MEYVHFFWFAWMIWIVVTFFVAKSKHQVLLGTAILLTIIGAPVTYTVSVLDVSPAYGIVIVLSCIWTGFLRPAYKWRVMILAVALMLLYASFQLMIWYNPVIFLFGEVWIPALVLFFVTIFVHGHAKSRYPLILLAFAFGELITAITVMPLTEKLYLADALFYNTLTTVLLLLVIWHLLEHLAWTFVRAGHTKRFRGSLSLKKKSAVHIVDQIDVDR